MKANHAADATEVTDSQKRKAPADAAVDGGPPRRTKKGKKGRRGGNSSASGSVAAEPAPQDLVAVSPLAPNSEILQVTGFRKTSVSINRNPIISLTARFDCNNAAEAQQQDLVAVHRWCPTLQSCG